MEKKRFPNKKMKISLLSQEKNRNDLQSSAIKKQQDEVRQILIKEIEDDIIGPRLGPEEEINANPTSEYLTGILHPKQTKVSTEDDETTSGSNGNDDTASLTEPIAANSGMMPSSIGLTCRITKNTQKVRAKISFGRYKPFKKDDDKEYDVRYKREPFEEIFDLDISNWNKGPISLKSDEYLKLKYSVKELDSENVLSVFLVNDREQEEKSRSSIASCIFQAKIILSSVDNKEKIFRDDKSYFGKTDPNDPDSMLFGLLFNYKKNFGTGHTCAVEWDEENISDNMINEIFTSHIPKQRVLRVSPFDLDMEGLYMKKLYSVKNFEEYNTLLTPIVLEYENWIKNLENKISDEKIVPNEFKETAKQQLVECKYALERIKAGIDIISKNEDGAGEIFQFVNRVMALQQSYGKWAKQNVKNKKVEGNTPTEINGKWRLFQVAFILMNIEPIIHPKSVDRKIADLLWFPTGGGKTEAYLGLVTFVIALRRMKGWDKNSNEMTEQAYGVNVIMRYTLRLLTVQQFQRASALMCACEHVRKLERIPGTDEKKWGDEPFFVGLWVGSGTTPNRLEGKLPGTCEWAIKTARRRHTILNISPSPFQLINCPWCGQELDEYCYEIGGTPKQCRVFCSRDRCEFSKKSNQDGDYLPVLVVDDDIYRRCPSLLIATVDKFAQIAWQEKPASIFGLVDKYCQKCGFFRSQLSSDSAHNHQGGLEAWDIRGGKNLIPPELIIQDELHLISGPLGTLTGLYETAIDLLCTRNLDGAKVLPKIIASTATTKTSSTQIHSLFGREDTRIFPPQGFNFGDSFFAKEQPVDEHPGKMYLGVCATGKSGLTILGRVSASLLRKVRYLKEKKLYPDDVLDPYFTLVSYFNSIRELGGAEKSYRDSVPGFMERIHKNELQKTTTKPKLAESNELQLSMEDLQNISESQPIPKEEDTEKAKQRWVDKIPLTAELTGRAESGEIPEILRSLEIELGDSENNALDLLLSTNMLSVGVDIPRLGVMIVNGQPKNHSEYIQATGRIGRIAPGLILASYAYLKPRDLSHYENFKYYHSTFFKNVEPVSITPFAPRARDAGLFGIFVGLVRTLIPRLSKNEDAQLFDPKNPNFLKSLNDIKDAIEARVDSIDPSERDDTIKQLDNIIELWNQYRKKKTPLLYRKNPFKYADKKKEVNDWFLLKINEFDENELIKTPLSLRDAEQEQKLWYMQDQDEEDES